MSAQKLARLRAMDAELEAKGFPPLSPWWGEQIERFYLHPTALNAVFRVGRGGAKSTTAVKIAVAEVLFGEWDVPPGERHYFVFVSENKDEAAGRLRLIASYLEALAVEHERVGDCIDLADLPLGFRVLAARIGAVSGPRAIGWCADELAKWKSADSNANPAPEVLTSLRAMTVTHPAARTLRISSPVGPSDEHYKAVARGDTEDQIVGIAPTWIANPSVTEAETRKLERDPRMWSREYAAIPASAECPAFHADLVTEAFRDVGNVASQWAPILVIDPSARGSDPFAWAVVRAVRQFGTGPEARVLHFSQFGSMPAGTRAEAILTRVCDVARLVGASLVVSDQFESNALEALFRQRGMRFKALDWTSKSKPDAVLRVRRWLADRCVVFDDDPQLRTELLGYEERVTDNGIRYSDRKDGHHFDRLSCVLTAALADEASLIDGSPLREVQSYRAFIGRGSDRATGPMNRSSAQHAPRMPLTTLARMRATK